MEESGANTLLTPEAGDLVVGGQPGLYKETICQRVREKMWREEKREMREREKERERNGGKKKLGTDFCVLASRPEVLLYIYLL